MPTYNRNYDDAKEFWFEKNHCMLWHAEILNGILAFLNWTSILWLIDKADNILIYEEKFLIVVQFLCLLHFKSNLLKLTLKIHLPLGLDILCKSNINWNVVDKIIGLDIYEYAWLFFSHHTLGTCLPSRPWQNVINN